jgi:hypothetical protein
MANKVTLKEQYTEAIKVFTEANRPDLVKFAEERIAVLKKKSANRKPTKTQEANAKLAEAVYDTLVEAGRGMTIAEIKATNPEFAEFSPQKFTGLFKVLGDRVIKTYDKKIAYFTAKVEDVEEVEE